MEVKLLAHTPNPEQIVAAAARLCYSKSTISDLLEALPPEKAAEFVRMLFSMGHESPFEHAVFTFGIEGVSRALTHQLVRHRIASYSQQSQRYVGGESFDMLVPPSVSDSPAASERYASAVEQAKAAYDELISLGIDKEDARFLLPGAASSRLVMTINARSLFNFFSHRCCYRAQWEIRELAEKMLLLVKEAAPTIFEKCGAPCLRGKCPEGEKSCGRQAEMREKYHG